MVSLLLAVFEELLCLPYVYLEKGLLAPLLQLLHFLLKMFGAVGGVDHWSMIGKLNSHAHAVQAPQVIGI